MYEGSETFRQFGSLERYGVNPTMTVKVDDATKVRFSYEYFHDERTADRGNPSQGRSSVPPSSTWLPVSSVPGTMLPLPTVKVYPFPQGVAVAVAVGVNVAVAVGEIHAALRL